MLTYQVKFVLSKINQVYVMPQVFFRTFKESLHFNPNREEFHPTLDEFDKCQFLRHKNQFL